MRTFTKKRLEIVVEAPVLSRVLDLLDRLAVTGYTVLPAVAGRGREGTWRSDGLVGEAGHMMVVACIVDHEKIDAVLDPVFNLVSRHIGIVSTQDIEVVRSDHF